MKLSICCAILIGALALAASSSRGEEKIPLLTVGSQTYTNVYVLDSTGAHLFIRHAGGLSTVNMEDMDPKLQAKFGYDPEKAKAQELVNQSSVKTPRELAQSVARTGAVGAPCDTPSSRRMKVYSLRDTGDLSLYFPYVWKDSMQQTPAGSPPSMVVRFDREIADNFLMLISSVPKGSRIKEMGLANALTMVGNRALPGSLEKEVVLQQLQGEHVDGYYFTLTDKTFVDTAHKPGKYKYQTQGLVNLGDFTLNFVICSNFLDTSDQKAALEMIVSARFAPK
jgi:hypothetical protein